MEGSSDQICAVIGDIYYQKARANFMRLFLSLNSFGNINLLATDLGTGVKEFFYLPARGIMNGPLEASRGIYLGTSSLLCNTGKGAFGSISRIADAISKGLLIWTGDREYMLMRERESIAKPENVLKGFSEGLRSGFTGVQSGMYGVYK